MLHQVLSNVAELVMNNLGNDGQHIAKVRNSDCDEHDTEKLSTECGIVNSIEVFAIRAAA